MILRRFPDPPLRLSSFAPLTALTLAAVLAVGCGASRGPATPTKDSPAATAAEGSGEPARPGQAQRGEIHPAPADTLGLVLLGTTDTHGYIIPYDYYTRRATDYGLAVLKPLVDSVRAAHPGRVYLFDSGDLLQGNPLAFLFGRLHPEEESPVVRAMELLGYAAAAIGNHEFNYGLPHLKRALEQADFPFVAANVFRHGTEQHAYTPYVLLPHAVGEGDTLLIGVTGVTPPGVHVWDRANVEGVLEFRDVVASVRPVVREMRSRGADLVVVLSHGGLEGTSYDTAATGLPEENAAARLAREEPAIDLIFLGHTHRELADSTINGVLLTQARNWGRSLAAVDVRLERRAAGDWRVTSKSGSILRPDPARPDTAFLDSLRWPHERTVAYVNSVAGRSSARLEARRARVEDTPILDFVNEVQRRTAGAELSAASAFTLGAVLPEGEVTVADIAGLYVYDNTLKAIRITGRQLRDYLEHSARYYNGWPPPRGGSVTNEEIPGYNFDVVSGVDYTIDLRRPVGSRITRLEYRGRAVRPDQSFTLAINNYRQGGGGGYAMIAGAPVVYDQQEDVRQLLIDEVARQSTIRPERYFQRNWRIVPQEAADSAAAEHSAQLAGAAAASGTGAAAGVERAEDPATSRPRLRVLATNDFHGRLLPDTPGWAEGRPVGGAAALAAYFARERAGFAGPVVLISGGDIMQGTPISNLTEGRATVTYYNEVDYTAAAIGNHEFDWGQAVLRSRIEDAEFPWLAANVFVAGADTAPAWIRDTATVELPGGVRVGIIGLATAETPNDTKRENVEGLEFRSLSAAVDRWVPILRGLGVDFVLVTAHSGAFCARDGSTCSDELIDVAREIRNRPDLMIGGHTHQVVWTRENGIPIVEAGSYGTRYAVVDLERVSADSVHAWMRGTPTTYADRVEPDSAISELVARFSAEVGPQVEAVVAEAAEALPRENPEYGLGRLIADALRRAAAADVGLINNSGIRAAVDRGPVTWGELYQVQPFQNQVVRARITGDQLRRVLEHTLEDGEPAVHVSGIRVEYDPTRAPGARVLRVLTEGGEELRPDGSYTVAVPDFLAQRGGGYAPLQEGAVVDATGVVDVDALIAHLRSLPQPFRAPDASRFMTRTD